MIICEQRTLYLFGGSAQSAVSQYDGILLLPPGNETSMWELNILHLDDLPELQMSNISSGPRDTVNAQVVPLHNNTDYLHFNGFVFFCS